MYPGLESQTSVQSAIGETLASFLPCRVDTGLRFEIIENFLSHFSAQEVPGVVGAPSFILVFFGEHTQGNRTAGKVQNTGVGPNVGHRAGLVGHLNLRRQIASEL